MEIGYLFRTGEKGKRIVGGADPKYPVEDLSWLDFTDKDIMIRTKSNDLLFKVKKIDIFPAISGKLNIGLTLYDDEQFNFLNIGDKVYKVVMVDSIE